MKAPGRNEDQEKIRLRIFVEGETRIRRSGLSLVSSTNSNLDLFRFILLIEFCKAGQAVQNENDLDAYRTFSKFFSKRFRF